MMMWTRFDDADGANFSIPLPKEEIQNGGAPWPHVDQSPLKRELNCVQGIMNLAPNGPTDGGLMVLSGSFPLYKQFFEEHAHEEPEGGWPKIDSYHHTPSQLQWFYDRGCEWKHVDAGAGDVILWDSRCIHYGAAPTGDNARYATCELGVVPAWVVETGSSLADGRSPL